MPSTPTPTAVAQHVVPRLEWSEGRGFDASREVRERALELGVGGFVLSPAPQEDVRALTKELRTRAKHPLLIAATMERGAGQALVGATGLPPLAAIASLGDADAVRKAARLTAREARTLGVTWELAPVLDLDLNPENPIVGSRSFGSDPALLEAAGAPVANLQVYPDAGPVWHPGRSAKLGLGPKTIVAAFGELHPSLTRHLDAPAGAVAAEIYLDAIPAPRNAGRARSAFAPPALQSITRDFAFIVPADLTADQLLRAIRGADKNAIIGVWLFDRFEAADGLSLAYEVTLQPIEASFTEDQIGAISKAVVGAAEKLGARLRV